MNDKRRNTMNEASNEVTLDYAVVGDSILKEITHPMYKDRLFRMIFNDRKELLGLYNAMNGTNYQNPEELEINTLENAIYMGMRNDLSFLVDSYISLYEHQSTHNPNMPLRNLFYVATLYSKLTKDQNLYGHAKILLPVPQFVVFYNGIEKQPERYMLHLSDLYEKAGAENGLELSVLVLNINPGYNQELMDNCKTLRDYRNYVEKVRTYRKETGLEQAVERAINECIADGMLADFLRNHRAEAKKVSIFEYNEEEHMRQVRDEGKKEGIEVGKKEGIEVGKKEGIEVGKKEGIEVGKEAGKKVCILVCKQILADPAISDEKLAATCEISIEEVRGIRESLGI